ncbi:hypothetical protein [Niveispirillum fermenti]|uniref:hypothetical protein n=1 Tax=Niveispirillum fermenti TaxID=1233113 RepID=UPI003A8B41AE
MTARNGTPWTDTEGRLLRDLFASGASNAEIAARLGRSEAAIRVKASALCLTRPWKMQAPPLQWPPAPAAAPPPPSYWHSTPAPPLAARSPKPAPTERRCMTCQKPFQSDGPHNRMCGTCRHLSQPFD